MVAYATAQQVQLDSLLGVLKTQPEANNGRARTLVALSETYATIQPKKGVAAAEEALRIARAAKDLATEADALNGKATCLLNLGALSEGDSLLQVALAIDRKLNRSHAIALDLLDLRYAFSSQAKPNSEDFLAEARRLLQNDPDRAALATTHWWYTSSAVLSSEVRKAHLDTAMVIYKTIGDSSGIARCLSLAVSYPPVINDPGQALAYRKEAIRLYEGQGDLLGQEWEWSNLGVSHVMQANYPDGLACFLKALEISELMGDMEMELTCLGNIAEVYLALDDRAMALRHYRQVMANDVPEGSSYLNAILAMADIHVQGGQADSARYYLNLHKRIHSGDIQTEAAYIARLTAEINRLEGNWGAALTGFRAAMKTAQLYTGYGYEEAMAALGAGLAMVHSSDKELRDQRIDPATRKDTARSYFVRALELAREQGLLKVEQDALMELSTLAESAGEIVLALKYHQEYTIVKDSVLNADKAKAVSLLAIQYETEKKEQQIALLGKDKEVQAKEIQKQKLVRNGFMGGFALVALFAGVFLFQRNRIGKEKKRSEELLLNILPAEVAEELKAKGEADAKQIDEVTVLFTDFKGFTAMSEKLTAKELVADIHECFSAFDRIMAKHGIEKIKTIGDAYMAAGGLPTPNTTHAVDVVKAALEIRDFIAEGKAHKMAAGLPYFEIRIGIHTGPVVAGIVGVKKFAYDIWGDTVNTASRMESSGEVGQVNISESTYALVKSEPGLTFTPRGKVQAKGKGEMEMFFVSSPN